MSKFTDSIYTTASTPLAGTELWLAVQPGTATGQSVQILPRMILTTGGITGQFPIKNSSSNYDATWGSMSSLVSASTGLSISGSTTLTMALATVAGLSVLGNGSTATATPLPIVGTAGQVLRINDAGTAVGFGAVNLASAAAVTGTLGFANFTSIHGLSVLANASSGTASVSAVTGTANDILAINSAATTVLFRSISSLLDRAVNSTQGSILYRNAATWTFLGGGTNGQILQTQGTAANPQWVGGMVLLNTLTPNGVASTNDTTSFTSTYRNYMITLENVCPATNTATLQMTVATAGSAFISGGYISVAQSNVSAVLTVDTSTTVILLSGTRATTAVATTTVNGVTGALFMMNAAGSAINKQINGDLSYHATASSTLATASLGSVEVTGLQNLTSAITGVNLAFSAGNIATGTIKIYGML